jgi:hypothetical protein
MMFKTFLLLVGGIRIAEAVEINEKLVNIRAQQKEDVSIFSTHGNRESSSYLRKLQTTITSGGVLADLFRFTLTITPDATQNTSICSAVDDTALRNDVNMILLNFGSGTMTVSGVCATSGFHNSSSLTSGQRKLAVRTAYIWTGGGACRGCSNDNFDILLETPPPTLPGNETRSRNLQVVVVGGGSVSSQVAAELANIISFQIVPRHQRCLGLSPVIAVNASSTGINELRGNCSTNNIPMLSISNLAKGMIFPFQRSICQTCISLDFSSTGATKQISGGTYVSTEWRQAYGVTVTASSTKGGFTPNKQARIYDTSLKTMQDYDLGAPNNKCGGPGVGLGGQPGQAGENCVPLKSKYRLFKTWIHVFIFNLLNENVDVLIIQDISSSVARASNYGGNITFVFDVPVFVSDIGFIDIDQTDQKLVFTYENGRSETFTFLGLGDNAVQRVVANQFRVKQIVVILTGKAAVTVLNYCPTCG